jgi:Lon protease-like protein
VRSEIKRALYREALVEWRYEETGTLVSSQRERLAVLVGEFLRRRDPEAEGRFEPPSDDELFVNAISQQLDLAVIERQALLEADGLSSRAARLIEVLEFHLEALRSGAIGTARPQ